MPSHAAMISKVQSAAPDDSVEKTLKLMQKEGVTSIAVVDEEKRMLGVFSMRSLMKNLLPVSISAGDSFDTQEVIVGAAPGIAKRYRNVQILPIAEFMDRDFPYVTPETPLWKTIDILVQYGNVIYVMDSESQKLSGVISSQSALDELQRLQD